MADPIRAELEALIAAYDEHGGKWPSHHEEALHNAVERARAVLAAEPPAPAEPTKIRSVLAAIIRRVDGSRKLGPAALAEAILSHPGLAWRALPPAPAPPLLCEPPAPAPAADGEREEREELAAWVEFEADNAQELGCATIYDHDRLRWIAALLRQPAPTPGPGWQPIDTAPQDGTEILASDYDSLEIVSWDAWETGSGWFDRNGQRLFPAWWQPLLDHPPIPQPPHGGEVGQ